ncbi:ABC transporter permease [Siminovitchia sp. FSL W7-1587]|uniref:ABC transporter permease n=1 Tax=Siminovitchia sp. FSL W7-1587 TaxID=2954699 RepID=UPI0030D28E5B
MNIVNKVTIRHLKENKRRTLVTIIGVIISVAMLTGVSTIGVSFMDLLKRQTIADKGEWHVLYRDVNPEQLEAIQKDEQTKKVILSKDIGYAYLEGSQDEYRPYVFLKSYDKEGFQHFPIELSSGRLPKKENEVVISEEIVTEALVNYKIGSSMKLEIGKREAPQSEITGPLQQDSALNYDENGEVSEQLVDLQAKEFTIVGIMKRPKWEIPWSPGYTIISYLNENSIGKDEPLNVSVVSKKLTGSFYKDTEKFAQSLGISDYEVNIELLRYSGVVKSDGMRQALYSVTAVIMAIILIGSVSLIYNAFAISVSERSRHLGMMASVGATKQQKRNSVFFEGMVIGLISIPIGILAGLGGIAITFMFINSLIQNVFSVTVPLKVTVTPGSLIAAVIVSVITIFISCFLPAIKASRISAIDAIRQTADVKLTGKAVKTSRLVRKIFGIEAEIGLKNLKRHKRRYKATIFSLVISIVLFLSVSFFTDNLKKALSLQQERVNYDIQVGLGYEDDEQFLRNIIKTEEITDYNLITESTLVSMVEADKVADPIREWDGFEDMLVDGKYHYNIRLHALKDEKLQAYAKQAGASFDDLKNGSFAILHDTVQFGDAGTGKYTETKAIHLKEGEELELFRPIDDETNETDEEVETEETEEEKLQSVGKIKVAKFTDQVPMGIKHAELGELNMIVSESTFKQFGLSEEESTPYLYLNSTDPVKTQKKIEEVQRIKHFIANHYQEKQRDEQLILILSVFTYGFISLITIISIANILNTISTSVSLRKREFAMLKSVGMTPKGFSRMIHYESIFYGIKALLYGLPLSFVAMYCIYYALGHAFSYDFFLPWLSILYVVIAVFVIVGISMMYSSSKVKKENIIDALKQENM